MKNPLCVDEIDIHLSFDGDRVSDVKFSGRGCAIFQSAASMMTQLIKGKTAAEIETMRERYREMIRGNADASRDRTLARCARSGVSRFPARAKCALLAWSALEEGINRRG